MSTPFELEAPPELVDSLAINRCFPQDISTVYSAGVNFGYGLGSGGKDYPEPVSQWPEPRSFDTDPPAFEDADPHGCISVLVQTGDWIIVPWERAHCTHPGFNFGWARSPRWMPKTRKPKSEAEHAIDALDHILKHSSTNLGETSIRAVLEKMRKLEQEGRAGQ